MMYTPPPWNRINSRISQTGKQIPGDEHVYSSHGPVCKKPTGTGPAAKNWEANARLITLAPEFLESLKEVVDTWQYGSSTEEAKETYDKALYLINNWSTTNA